MNRINPELLLRARKAASKTQGDLASVLKIDQSAYSRKERLGDFSNVEIDKICKALGIKKEQIELRGNELVIQELTFITNTILKTESILTVMLSTQAEILAKLTDGNATKIRTDLESAVSSLTRQALEQLGHQV